METGKPYPIRVWLERSGNKLVNVADGKRWAAASKNVPFIVHMYMYPTSFTSYADMILPTEEWLETDMLQESCNRMIIRQATTHLWETVDETMIWSMIAKRCAELGDKECQKAFDAEYMGDDLPYWNSVVELLDVVAGRVNTTWEDLKKNAPIDYMSEEKFRNYYAYLHEDPSIGKESGFNTPSRKLELYLERLITLGRTGTPYAVYSMPPRSKDYDPLPYYLEPYESPLGEMAKEYPLVMTNGRLPMYHHSTLRNNAYTREIYPAPEVWLHPNAAAKYGIEDNQWVWVESQRGRVRGVSHITSGINEGTVYMERYWNPENMNKDTHGWQEMNVSVLARSKPPYNDVFGTYTLRGYLVKVYPAPEGAPEGVWLDPKEFKPWLATASDPTPDMTKGER
jgi:anaerobic selenocysteine-containing dehydrogenase